MWKNARETVAKANRENATPIVMNTAVYIGDKQTMKRKMEAAAVDTREPSCRLAARDPLGVVLERGRGPHRSPRHKVGREKPPDRRMKA